MPFSPFASFAKAAEKPDSDIIMVDALCLEKLDEVVMRMGCIGHEMQALRARVAFLENHLQAHEMESEGSSAASESSCCEAGFAQQAMRKSMTTLRKSMTTMTTLKLTRPTYALVESFWDATLFAGLEEVGMAGSLMIFFGVTVSFCLQMLFCWIVVSCFLGTDKKYDLEYLAEWRVLYGHSVFFYDQMSGASLVSKVCQGRPFDRDHWNDALINEINLYLRPVFSPEIPGLTIGVVLCSMALIIWACHISAELQSVSRFASAIYRLPRGHTHVSASKGGKRSLESISYRRFVLLSVVVLARFFVAVFLGVSGGMWLCHGRDVAGIMLNAVALLFILEIDDLLYKVLAPKHAMQYLASMDEFEVGTRKTWAGIDLSSIVKLLMLVVTVALFFRFSIYENALEAHEARELLCGGNLNFVYGSHPSLGPLFVTETEDYNLTRAATMLPGMHGFVTGFVFNFDQNKVKDYMWRGTLPHHGELAVKHVPKVSEMKQWLAMSESQAAEQSNFGSKNFGTFCEDKPWDDTYWEADWVWSTVKVLTGATNCAEAQPFCDKKEVPLVRMVCPQTCGCTRADAGLFVDNGCRQLCQKEEQFKRSLNATKCEQSPTVHETEAWKRWWRGFYGANADTWREDNAMMKFAKSGAPQNCSFLKTEPWIPTVFCSHKSEHRPGTVFCPITCGCLSGRGDWCPTGGAACTAGSKPTP